MTIGGKNLVILGTVAIAIAVVTTTISLVIYHNSGDIYLDRSRPGYLPDEDEITENNTKEEYDFSNVETLDMQSIEDYLDHLQAEVRAIDAYDKPFGAEVLSNQNLGIPDDPKSGISSSALSVFTTVAPILNPVKDPGPLIKVISLISCQVLPFSASLSRTNSNNFSAKSLPKFSRYSVSFSLKIVFGVLVSKYNFIL